jgi:hypothetical protein
MDRNVACIIYPDVPLPLLSELEDHRIFYQELPVNLQYSGVG